MKEWASLGSHKTLFTKPGGRLWFANPASLNLRDGYKTSGAYFIQPVFYGDRKKIRIEGISIFTSPFPLNDDDHCHISTPGEFDSSEDASPTHRLPDPRRPEMSTICSITPFVPEIGKWWNKGTERLSNSSEVTQPSDSGPLCFRVYTRFLSTRKERGKERCFISEGRSHFNSACWNNNYKLGLSYRELLTSPCSRVRAHVVCGGEAVWYWPAAAFSPSGSAVIAGRPGDWSFPSS